MNLNDTPWMATSSGIPCTVPVLTIIKLIKSHKSVNQHIDLTHSMPDSQVSIINDFQVHYTYKYRYHNI